MPSIFKKIPGNIEIVLSALFLSVTVGVVIINVILRYAFQSGLFWTEEVATACFIWSVFIGAAGAYKHKMHIGIDLVTNFLPERARELVSLGVHLLMALINGYICYLSLLLIQANQLKRTPVLDIPSVYINLAITVGFGLMTCHGIRFFIGEARLFFASPQGGGRL